MGKIFGPKSFNELPEIYHDADIGLFASSCENMPNIIIEKMASGLPILCSKNSPMPEIIGEGAIYFDPENITSISDSILMVLKSSELRSSISKKAYNLSKKFCWNDCSNKTFKYLSDIAKLSLVDKTNYQK